MGNVQKEAREERTLILRTQRNIVDFVERNPCIGIETRIQKQIKNKLIIDWKI